MIVFYLFIFGLCVGSFLNVCIDRIPRRESIFWGRSHCDHCKHQLHWYELVPLLSFFFQNAKTRCCRKPLSLQYPLVELVTGIGFVLLYFAQVQTTNLFQTFNFFLSIIIFCSLLVMFVSDFKTEIIPAEMLIVCVISTILFHGMNGINLTNVMNIAASGFFAWLFFFCLWFFSKGKAMGDGDMYVALIIGLLLGFPRIVIALYAAFLTGALAGVILIFGRKKSLHAHIPFGPFLIWGLVVGLVWGDVIFRFWRTLL